MTRMATRLLGDLGWARSRSVALTRTCPGTAFSLLPPQNATGNWVKVTQRVPVRIKITDPDPAHALRIGTTATVKVRK